MANKTAPAPKPGTATGSFPLADGVSLTAQDEVELTLNGSWRPTLSITGADGLPAPADAGNVLRPHTTLCLSFRLPPTADSSAALDAVRTALTTDVPYGAQVEWPGMATLANLPATAVPIGTTAAGLPIGAQVIGPYLEDRTTLAFAALLGGL